MTGETKLKYISPQWITVLNAVVSFRAEKLSFKARMTPFDMRASFLESVMVIGKVSIEMKPWVCYSIYALYLIEKKIGKRKLTSKLMTKLLERCIQFEEIDHVQSSTTKS